MEETASKVYIKTDSKHCILRCEGGYSVGNIQDFTDWTLIDEGFGDRYNLCQSNYFPNGLYTEEGIPLYKWDGHQVQLRTEAEISADREAIPLPPNAPSVSERLDALENAMLTMMGGMENV